MNKRILELARQVWPDPNTSHVNHEKFAELIVRECVGILSVNEDTKIKMGLDEPMFKLFKGIAKAYSDNIKEHFGVEE
jgi:arabinogalactan endo-1,4-beta-galactosidase